MENKTIQLLKSVENALKTQPDIAGQIAFQDIVDCTVKEIQLNGTLIPQTQYKETLERYLSMANQLCDGNYKTLCMLVSLSLLALSTLPQTMDYYTSDEWWSLKLKEGYTDEFKEIRKNIASSGKLQVFNYPFTQNYDNMSVDVFIDEENNFPYIIYKNKRMYFPKTHTREQIIEYCHGIFMEQDRQSPHSYIKDGFEVKEGDIIVDAGVAEGNFALDNIDIASQIYLIEADPIWADALRITFKDYSDKVTIINAYLDSQSFDDHVCIDNLNLPKINYIKMDIEGFERNALLGAVRTLEESSDIRLAICSYHNNGDEKWIRAFLSDYNFETDTSKGLMFAEWQPGALVDVDFRKGIVFARKE